MKSLPGETLSNKLLRNVPNSADETMSNSTAELTTMMLSFLNATDDTVTSAVTSMTLAEIVTVSLLLVISFVAILMNSGILMLIYGLKLISKDYRMIYYSLITLTDLTFSIHSVISCMTLIFKHVNFFKLKSFCLVLQCTGTTSYQISAMSIILLVFDLFKSIRDPFNTETKRQHRISVAACLIAVLIATSLAYIPFIWWYGTERELEFCSIANVYGVYFHNYHIMTTTVLAFLFFLMIVASFLLLREIKKSIQPRRPKLSHLSIPTIFRNDNEERKERKLKTGDNTRTDADDPVFVYEGSNTDLSSAVTKETDLPDLLSDVEKVTMRLSDYSGIDNKAFDIEERNSVRNTTLQQLSRDKLVTEDFTNEQQETDKQPTLKDTNTNSEGYKVNHKASANTIVSSSDPNLTDNLTNNSDKTDDEAEKNITGITVGYINNAFESNEENKTESREQIKDGEVGSKIPDPISMVQTPEDGQDENCQTRERLSVDNATRYRGSVDKVRRLTGTELVGQDIKDISIAHSAKRKKFMQACKTVAAFMTAFLGCCLPYYILGVVELTKNTETEDSQERRTIRVICAMFLYLLPIVDPILYTSRFQIIRQTLYRLFAKCCKCTDKRGVSQ